MRGSICAASETIRKPVRAAWWNYGKTKPRLTEPKFGSMNSSLDVRSHTAVTMSSTGPGIVQWTYVNNATRVHTLIVYGTLLM